MYLVEMMALRPLCGDDYGRVSEGDRFTTNNQKAEMLESKGLACRYRLRPTIRPKAILFSPENKMIQPDNNKGVASPEKRGPGRPHK